jgi:ACS family allantoate permease-like MFS transporter
MATAAESTRAPTDAEKDTITMDNDSPRSGPKLTLDEKLLKHSHDVDAAMKAFEGIDGQVIELTEEKKKALLRKIDLHLMPVRSPAAGGSTRTLTLS